MSMQWRVFILNDDDGFVSISFLPYIFDFIITSLLNIWISETFFYLFNFIWRYYCYKSKEVKKYGWLMRYPPAFGTKKVFLNFKVS